jgi:hypothetical protein
MSVENIGIVSATTATTWSVASSFLHLPPGWAATAAGVVGGIGVWQSFKAKLDERRKRNEGDDG